MADARAKGQSTDEALAITDDAVAQDQMANMTTDESEAKAGLRLLRDFENSIEAGFQMAAFQGPLCAEPVVGMAWVVENVKFNKEAEDNESESTLYLSPRILLTGILGRGKSSAVVGALISSVRDSCRAGMLDWSPRIKLAMYTCDIQASSQFSPIVQRANQIETSH